MFIRRLEFVFAMALVAASRPASAQLCPSGYVPPTLTDWAQTITLPRFDAALGALQAVHVVLASQVDGSAGVENLDPQPLHVDLYLSASVKLQRPDGSAILTAQPILPMSVSLSPFDGFVDFAGTSGVLYQHLLVDALPAPSTTLVSGADLALFTGPAGTPGTITLLLDGLGRSYASAATNPALTFTSHASASVTVCYDYEPVLTSFCTGEGSGTACPCGNASDPVAGTGCVNSAGFGGHLFASGAARIGADTFVLSADLLPSGTTALFTQGTARVNGGAGVVFGDGLRCIGGTLTRLGQKVASNGTCSAPGAGDAPISIAGHAQAGDLREYQAWYRDGASFCTSAPFNLTQALEVRWAP